MHIKHLHELHQKQLKSNVDFYTPTGIHVFFKDHIDNKKVDVEEVIATIESKIPIHLVSEIEMVIIGWFKEFEERNINAFYDSGTIYISNVQSDNEDLFDDLVHELSHAIEVAQGYYIYADQKIKDEFLRKRKHLHDLLWARGIKAPESFFMDPEFDQEFDDFLYKKVGYDKLSSIMSGLFISPYAATSLREYFATGFTEFYLDSNHQFLKKLSPELYNKIYFLQDPKKLEIEA